MGSASSSIAKGCVSWICEPAVDAEKQKGQTPYDVAKSRGHEKEMGLLHPVADGQGPCSSSEMQAIPHVSQPADLEAEPEEAKDDVISPEDLAEADKAEAEGCQDILEAAKENKVGAIRHFLRSDVNSVQKTDEEGKTPLHLAAENGHDSVVQSLVEAKVAVDAQNKKGSTPLHFAAQQGAEGIVQRLLEAKAAVDAKNNIGFTPLHVAARSGHLSAVARLIEARAAVDVKENEVGLTPLHYAAAKGHVSAVERLVEARAAVDVQDNNGETPLHVAARYGQAHAVARLIEAKAAVDAKANNGRTPLHRAAFYGQVSAVARLIEAAAVVDVQDKYGRTPLHHAAINGHVSAVARLIEARAAVDVQDEYGRTPLHHAAANGHVSAVERLVEARAAVDVQDNDGRTPYDLAKENGEQKVMDVLHPVFVSLLSGRTCRCSSSKERSIKELKEEAEQKLGVTIQHLIGSDMEPLTESKRLEEANVLPNSTVTAIIAAAKFHYYEVVFKADDDLQGLRFEWEPPVLIDLPNCVAVDTELQVRDELIEVNDVDVTELKRGEIEPRFTARPLKLAFRRKCEEPTETGDDLQDPKAFIEFLISANIRLARLEFLLELHEQGRSLPRRQEAEAMRTRNGDTALVEIHEYKKLHVNDVTGRVSMPIAARTSALTTVNFCAVSHMWESMQHPDPWGFQLAQIAEKYSKHIGNGLTWVFLDYVSLFQFRRTPEEDRWFYKALDGMHILYSHEAVEVTILVDLTPEHLKSAREVWAFSEAGGLVVLMSIAMLRLNATPHHLRGWCQAEKQWALLRGLLLAGCVPLCPDAFKQLMQEMRFTHRNDAPAVFKLQEKVFKLKTSTTTQLQLEKLDRVALDNLREALPHYTKLTDIAVSGTPLSNEDALALLRSGASDVQMENCELNDVTVIAEALLDKSTAALKLLNLRRNGIADLGPLEDVMQQRPGLIIEMTPQKLDEAGETGNVESAECSAGGI